MDIVYSIRQVGNNNILFNETVNVVDPFFLCVITNPWTAEEKTLHIIPEETDGEWILNIIGIGQAYQDLGGGSIYFPNIGTYEVSIYLNEVVASALIRNCKFQVIEV